MIPFLVGRHGWASAFQGCAHRPSPRWHFYYWTRKGEKYLEISLSESAFYSVYCLLFTVLEHIMCVRFISFLYLTDETRRSPAGPDDTPETAGETVSEPGNCSWEDFRQQPNWCSDAVAGSTANTRPVCRVRSAVIYISTIYLTGVQFILLIYLQRGSEKLYSFFGCIIFNSWEGVCLLANYMLLWLVSLS